MLSKSTPFIFIGIFYTLVFYFIFYILRNHIIITNKDTIILDITGKFLAGLSIVGVAYSIVIQKRNLDIQNDRLNVQHNDLVRNNFVYIFDKKYDYMKSKCLISKDFYNKLKYYYGKIDTEMPILSETEKINQSIFELYKNNRYDFLKYFSSLYDILVFIYNNKILFESDSYIFDIKNFISEINNVLEDDGFYLLYYYYISNTCENNFKLILKDLDYFDLLDKNYLIKREHKS